MQQLLSCSICSARGRGRSSLMDCKTWAASRARAAANFKGAGPDVCPRLPWPWRLSELYVRYGTAYNRHNQTYNRHTSR